jgi:PPOX class probable FMN-dependent enzyme
MNDLSQSSPIADSATLREHFGEPLDLAVVCMKPHLDRYHQDFIRHSPFLCLATADGDGQPNVSPKGDAPGFVTVLDERTLVIPDRPGNNKVESFQNIVANPKVALIFFIPGIRESLRVHGEARIVRDEEVRALGRVGHKLPPVATVIKVTQAYFHCGKALIRSKLWQPESRLAPGTLASFGEVIKAEAGLDSSASEAEARLEEAYRDGLY